MASKAVERWAATALDYTATCRCVECKDNAPVVALVAAVEEWDAYHVRCEESGRWSWSQESALAGAVRSAIAAVLGEK